MRPLRAISALALTAALGLGAAACGDDDDEAAATDPPVEQVDESDDEAEPADDGGAVTEAPAGAATEAEAPVDDPELAADCEAWMGVGESLDDLPEPVVGEPVSDEILDGLDEFIGELEDADLQSDLGQQTLDDLIEFTDELRDADEFTEEHEEQAGELFTEFINECVTLMSAGTTTA